jgi:maltooligosyltrehalose trehalohydrolase
MSHLVSLDRCRIGAALILLSPYVPMLFQGEEWGASSPFQYFVDFRDDPRLADAVRVGRTQEFAAFGWNPQNVPDPTVVSTLINSRLKWEELARPEHSNMLEWYRSLIQVRRQIPQFTSGRRDQVDVRYDAERSWLAVNRGGCIVVCNLSSATQTVPLERARRQVLLFSKPAVELADDGVVLPAESVAVLSP